MNPQAFELLEDIVIKKGTIFRCIDGQTSQYIEGNYETTIGLTADSSGSLVYGIDLSDPHLSNYFKETNV